VGKHKRTTRSCEEEGGGVRRGEERRGEEEEKGEGSNPDSKQASTSIIGFLVQRGVGNKKSTTSKKRTHKRVT